MVPGRPQDRTDKGCIFRRTPLVDPVRRTTTSSQEYHGPTDGTRRWFNMWRPSGAAMRLLRSSLGTGKIQGKRKSEQARHRTGTEGQGTLKELPPGKVSASPLPPEGENEIAAHLVLEDS